MEKIEYKGITYTVTPYRNVTAFLSDPQQKKDNVYSGALNKLHDLSAEIINTEKYLSYISQGYQYVIIVKSV